MNDTRVYTLEQFESATDSVYEHFSASLSHDATNKEAYQQLYAPLSEIMNSDFFQESLAEAAFGIVAKQDLKGIVTILCDAVLQSILVGIRLREIATREILQAAVDTVGISFDLPANG